LHTNNCARTSFDAEVPDARESAVAAHDRADGRGSKRREVRREFGERGAVAPAADAQTERGHARPRRCRDHGLSATASNNNVRNRLRKVRTDLHVVAFQRLGGKRRELVLLAADLRDSRRARVVEAAVAAQNEGGVGRVQRHVRLKRC